MHYRFPYKALLARVVAAGHRAAAHGRGGAQVGCKRGCHQVGGALLQPHLMALLWQPETRGSDCLVAHPCTCSVLRLCSGSMAQNTVITELYKKTAEVKVRACRVGCSARFWDQGCGRAKAAAGLQGGSCQNAAPPPSLLQAKAVQEYVQLLLDNGQKFLIFAVSRRVWAQSADCTQLVGANDPRAALSYLCFAAPHLSAGCNRAYLQPAQGLPVSGQG